MSLEVSRGGHVQQSGYLSALYVCLICQEAVLKSPAEGREQSARTRDLLKDLTTLAYG